MTQPQQFDYVKAVSEDLSTQLAEKARDLAVTRAQLTEATQFIASHADELGMEVVDGQLRPKTPAPPVDPTAGSPSSGPDDAYPESGDKS